MIVRDQMSKTTASPCLALVAKLVILYCGMRNMLAAMQYV